MEKLNNIQEAILALKDKEILSTNKKDRYVFKKNNIYVYNNGTSFVLTLDDFKELYKEKTFYIFIEEGSFIDNDKDEAYYRYYRK